MDEMMREISKYANGTCVRIKWKNDQLVLGGRIDTIYETDNGVDKEDINYKEFYACALRVEKIIQNPKNIDCSINSLVEISVENQPTLITLFDGSIIWEE